MSELRVQIIEAMEASWNNETDDFDPFAAADRILAIPAIAEALKNQTCDCGQPATLHECMACGSNAWLGD